MTRSRNNSNAESIVLYPMKASTASVANNALRHFRDVIHPQAVRIFTPFTKRLSVSKAQMGSALRKVLERYEPRLATDGLFPHQDDFFKAYLKDGKQNFIITTATGSGKSLCFWGWVFQHLCENSYSTALLCFPTQALMWGQADRLTRLSESRSLALPGKKDTPYGGSIKIGKDPIGWTVWHGTGSGPTYNAVMAEHERSPTFARARIRLATLDKAHWSLNGSPSDRFARNLQCVVLDEAHMYQGVFGANVHYFLKRLYMSSEILGRRRPDIFLASATLSSAKKFASTLLTLTDEKALIHIEDSTKQEITLIPTSKVPHELDNPPTDGLLRIVLLLNSELGDVRLLPFMANDKNLGPDVNAIYFSQSKFESKRLALDIKKRISKREVIIYDADLPPARRRMLEKRLNDPNVNGTTVLATNALELGIDIEGLDVCLMEHIPPRRADMLQRIGRVGRRSHRPGLVMLRLTVEPQDQRLKNNPIEAFQLDRTRATPIPVHLEMLKLKSMLAAFREWLPHIRSTEIGWPAFNGALQNNFGESPGYQELKARFSERYGALVDMSDGSWVHKGFRASASDRRIPLLDGDNEIARIDNTAIFRDAHPEAVFLGHDLGRFRVEAYDGKWQVAKWEHPSSDEVLGKWLRTISAVRVCREPRPVTTRGMWEEHFELYECVTKLPKFLYHPTGGSFEFGIWNYMKKWQGYTEINLRTGKAKKVDRGDAIQRFWENIEQGKQAPFLFDYSYRTWGWQWQFGALDSDLGSDQRSLGDLTGSILEHFFADAVQSRVEDITVSLDLTRTTVQVLDSTPGGNGLSEALLTDDRFRAALDESIAVLSKLSKGKDDRFQKYVLELCNMPVNHSAKDVLDVIKHLQLHWTS